MTAKDLVILLFYKTKPLVERRRNQHSVSAVVSWASSKGAVQLWDVLFFEYPLKDELP